MTNIYFLLFKWTQDLAPPHGFKLDRLVLPGSKAVGHGGGPAKSQPVNLRSVPSDGSFPCQKRQPLRHAVKILFLVSRCVCIHHY